MLTLRVFGTPVRVKAAVLVDILVVWMIVTWVGLREHPERSLWQALLIGLLTAAVMLIAEYGHPVAHIFSARYAAAPMDEILISAEMSRTLYRNNDVPARAHRLRATGGPVFNVLGLLLSLAIYAAAPAVSIVHELAGWSSLAHGLLLLMSLVPVPPVDGGVLLKWTMVMRGKTPAEADQIIRTVDWVLAAAAGCVGLLLLAMRAWLAGAICAVIAIVVAAVTAGKIR